MSATKARKDLEANWWKDWWAEDYSWEGLANRQIAGTGGVNGERTLQAYWVFDPVTGKARSESELLAAGELEIAPDGKLWHIAHIPMVWLDGSEGKLAWGSDKRDKLAMLINARMNQAITLGHRFHQITPTAKTEPETHALLDGAVLIERPSVDLFHISAYRAHLIGWSSENARFTSFSRFTNAIFIEPLNLRKSEFIYDIDFSGVVFSGPVNFENCKFSGNAKFSACTFFSNVRFDSVVFLKLSEFQSSVFWKDVRFSFSIFSNYADFDDARFQGHASFSGANVLKSINFGGTIFSRVANFDSIKISDQALFGSAVFYGESRFYNASFGGDAFFRSSYFHGGLFFSNAHFQKNADFSSSCLGRQAASSDSFTQMSFRYSVFEGDALFTNATFGTDPAHHSAAFLGTRFAKLVDFRGCGDEWLAALHETEIKGRILIDERNEAESLRDFDLVVLPRARDGGVNPTTNTSLLKELEGGCRTVKVAMGAARNEIMEQRFYRFQLRARREQIGVPRPERWVSHIYGVTADYGLSLWRPLLGLFLLITYSTGLYIVLKTVAEGTRLDASQIGDCLLMSLSRIFPFGAFEGVSDDWIKEFLKVDDKTVREAGWSLLVRGFATLQSLFALVLVFLFGLAVRRRFKVGE